MSIDTSKGYVAFPRGLTDWEWYDDVNTCRVFFHLMLTANWEAKNWRGVAIEPGGQVTSIAHLAQAVGLSRKAVRTALDHLTATSYLTVKTTNKFSVITVNNWGTITGSDRLNGTQKATDNGSSAKELQKNGKQNGKQKNEKQDGDSSEFCRNGEIEASKTANKGQTSGKQRATTKPLKPLEPLKQSSSSKSPSADDRAMQNDETTMTTISPEEFWVQNGLGQAVTPTLQDRLSEYRRQGVEETLIVQAMREAVEHNAAAPLPYVRKVLDQAVTAGELTLDAWQAHHLRYRPRGRVDRPEPSGNDFLRDAADRPRRLKRKE